MRSAAMTSFSDRKSTRLNSSHTEIYTLSLHDALPIYGAGFLSGDFDERLQVAHLHGHRVLTHEVGGHDELFRSEEHTSELQSHRDLHSFPTRRSSDLWCWISQRRFRRAFAGSASAWPSGADP